MDLDQKSELYENHPPPCWPFFSYSLILGPLPHKCGVPVVAERRIYAAAGLQNLKMRIAVLAIRLCVDLG
ncbi:MAG TPA: hypothetical protein VG146_17710 [Verrucomicrobiae bacterium]|nr:hypothetical protein [Verrucomicrobiae bacterium]